MAESDQSGGDSIVGHFVVVVVVVVVDDDVVGGQGEVWRPNRNRCHPGWREKLGKAKPSNPSRIDHE